MRSLLFTLLLVVVGLPGCKDDDVGATPQPPAYIPITAEDYEAAGKASKEKLTEIRTLLRKGTASLSEIETTADKSCPDDIASRTGPKWNAAFVLTTDSLDFFLQDNPVFPSEGSTGFRPGRPAWTKAPSAGVAVIGRGQLVLAALEALAFVEPKYGADLMNKAGIKASNELIEGFAMPELLMVYRSQGDVASKVPEGEQVKVGARTGEKSIAIKGGSSGGQVVVLDAKDGSPICYFKVSGSDTGGYGSGPERISSALLRDIDSKLGTSRY